MPQTTTGKPQHRPSQRAAERRLTQMRSRRASQHTDEATGAAAIARAIGLDPVEVSLRSKPYDYVLAHVREVSENARSTWFGLIGLLLFCGITLLGVKDQDFFAFGAETALPIMGLSVPTFPFFVTAPFATLALYVYLHVYLVKLWRSLAAAPPVIEGRALDELVFPWLLSDAALRWRTDGAFQRPFGWLTALISWFLGWAAGPLVIALFWIRSAPAHHEGLTIYLAILLGSAIAVGWRSRRLARRAMRYAMQEMPDGEVTRLGILGSLLRWILFPIVMAVLVITSWEMTEGGMSCPRAQDGFGAKLKQTVNCWITENASELIAFGQELRTDVRAETGPVVRTGLIPAAMAEAEITVKPIDWIDRDLARSIYRRDYAQGFRASLTPDEPLPIGWENEADREFAAQRREYLSRISVKHLDGADLRGADLRGAFIANGRLRAARLDGANLTAARMEGADLSSTTLTGADLGGARLDAARLDNVDFTAALLHEVRLGEAEMSGADLTGASLISTRFENAKIEYANFTNARLHGARLSGANATDNNFSGAEIWRAWLNEADLSWSNFEGASLDGSYLAGANLEGAQGITQEMLEQTYGDSRTVLPDGLSAPTHWPLLRVQSSSVDARDAYLSWRQTEYGE